MSADSPDLGSMTDQELVAAYRGGQVAAFEEIVRRYRGEMHGFLFRFVRNRAAADDVFQETFLQIHNSIETFDLSKRFKPWLFTIGANKARDYLRRKKRHRAAPLSATVDGSGDGAAFVDLMEADLPGPDSTAAAEEMAQRVRGAVDQMPDHLRKVIVLAYFKQMAYKEVAEALGIPLGTVKSRLHAAVGHFATLWKDHFDDTPPAESQADETEG